METYCVSCKNILRTKIQMMPVVKFNLNAVCGKEKSSFIKNKEFRGFD